MRLPIPLLFTLAAVVPLAPYARGQQSFAAHSDRQRGHDTTEWVDIAAHLPSRLTAPAAALEQQGDVLRARRFPEDANDYYNFALQSGGHPGPLLDKLGLTELDLRDVPTANRYFRRVVSINRNDAEGWNNLGVVEHLNGRITYAIGHYERAVRLDPERAIFRANLAVAYLDHDELPAARREIAAALRLDASVFNGDEDSPGPVAQVISTGARARLSFEIARVCARNGNESRMMHELASASEAGMDVRHEMRKDKLLARYVTDDRVAVVFRNADLLHLIGEADSSGSLDPTPGAGAGN